MSNLKISLKKMCSRKESHRSHKRRLALMSESSRGEK